MQACLRRINTVENTQMSGRYKVLLSAAFMVCCAFSLSMGIGGLVPDFTTNHAQVSHHFTISGAMCYLECLIVHVIRD